MSVITLEQNDLAKLFSEYAKSARSGVVTSAIIIAQTEDEESVSWVTDEAGEISYDPDHILGLIGILNVQITYATEAFRESLDD